MQLLTFPWGKVPPAGGGRGAVQTRFCLPPHTRQGFALPPSPRRGFSFSSAERRIWKIKFKKCSYSALDIFGTL